MQHRSKKVYLSIAVAVVVVLAAIVTATIYLTTSTSVCNESSTTTVYPAYNANLSSPYSLPSYVGLSMLPGCTVKVHLQFNSEFSFSGPTNSSTYTLHLDNTTGLGGTFVGAWYYITGGGTWTGVHRIQNDTLNATVYPSTVTSSNHTGPTFTSTPTSLSRLLPRTRRRVSTCLRYHIVPGFLLQWDTAFHRSI